jgi:hypothetical protein
MPDDGLTKTGGDEELVTGELLTPKERAFVDAFGDPESPTYSRGTLSAEAAGFSQPHSAQWKLRRRPRVARALEAYQEMSRAAIGKVLADLEHTRQRALEKGDLAVAARCSELQGRHLGAFFERSVLTLDTTPPDWDERVAVEASRLARLMLEDAGERGLGALPASAQLAGPEHEPENQKERV